MELSNKELHSISGGCISYLIRLGARNLFAKLTKAVWAFFS